MILGMSTEAFTLFHIVISLIAIASGAVVTVGMWRAQRLPGWTAVGVVAARRFHPGAPVPARG